MRDAPHWLMLGCLVVVAVPVVVVGWWVLAWLLSIGPELVR